MVRQSRRTVKVVLVVVLLALCLLGMMSVSASAVVEAPGWHVFDRVGPTDLPPGGEGGISLYVYDTGAAASGEGTLTDTLPSDLTLAAGSGCSGVGTHVATCTVPSLLPSTAATAE